MFYEAVVDKEETFLNDASLCLLESSFQHRHDHWLNRANKEQMMLWLSASYTWVLMWDDVFWEQHLLSDRIGWIQFPLTWVFMCSSAKWIPEHCIERMMFKLNKCHGNEVRESWKERKRKGRRKRKGVEEELEGSFDVKDGLIGADKLFQALLRCLLFISYVFLAMIHSMEPVSERRRRRNRKGMGIHMEKYFVHQMKSMWNTF